MAVLVLTLLGACATVEQQTADTPARLATTVTEPAPATTATPTTRVAATTRPATTTTSTPEVVDVMTASDHCGQPAVGEPVTGFGSDARKVSFDAGSYTLEFSAEGDSNLALWLEDITGELDWADSGLIDSVILDGSWESGVRRFDIEVGGDIELRVEAEQATTWTARFNRF